MLWGSRLISPWGGGLAPAEGLLTGNLPAAFLVNGTGTSPANGYRKGVTIPLSKLFSDISAAKKGKFYAYFSTIRSYDNGMQPTMNLETSISGDNLSIVCVYTPTDNGQYMAGDFLVVFIPEGGAGIRKFNT